MEPIDIQDSELQISARGHLLTVTRRISNHAQLEQLIRTLHLGLPAVLNLDFMDPPILEQVTGTVGESEVRWELDRAAIISEPSTREEQERKVVQSLQRLDWILQSENFRVLMALHYFHVACRLLNTEHGPWEFMGEAILNFTRVLQVLFGESRVDVRGGLALLGIDRESIEGDFIPMMLLRAKFEVAHANVAVVDDGALKVIYQYLEAAEASWRELLREVITQSESGGWSPDVSDLKLKPQRVKELSDLVTSITKRLSVAPTGYHRRGSEPAVITKDFSTL